MKGVNKISKILLDEGYQAYLVGGCVRDKFLGIKPKDYDIATDARPDDLLMIAKKYDIIVKEVGKDFGVILFVMDRIEYEIATFREDGIYSAKGDFRRPDSVTYSDFIEDDLARRDFTINAMAIDISTDTLVDPFGGMLDLQAKKLKTVGNPEKRFNQDYLRIIRFFRFAARFDMEPDERAMDEIASDPARVLQIAHERIGMEMEKILMMEVPSRAFKLMLKTGVLNMLIPELDILKVVPQDMPHLDSVWDHTMKALDYAAMLGADYTTRMAVLLHDCGKYDAITVEDRIRFKEHSKYSTYIADTILESFKVPNRFKSDVKDLIHYHMTLHHVSTKGLFKRYINKMGVEQVNRLLMLNLADTFDGRITVDNIAKIERLDQAIADLQEEQSRFNLRVDGSDIMHYVGIEPGPNVGKIKKLMEYLVAEEVIPDKQCEQIIFLEALKENWFT